jgi:hypothetical protein
MIIISRSTSRLRRNFKVRHRALVNGTNSTGMATISQLPNCGQEWLKGFFASRTMEGYSCQREQLNRSRRKHMSVSFGIYVRVSPHDEIRHYQ